jgi:hypothetical protein
MQSVHLDSNLIANSKMLSCELEGEGVILDTQSKRYFGLNEVGVHIWQQLSVARCVREIVESVIEEFEIEQARCEVDCLAFLESLLNKKLIRIV